MRERAKAVADSLAAARSGSLEALGQTLDGFRAYLLAIAEREVDPQLKAKGGASDLVQETLLEAVGNFAAFRGKTDADLKAWLRQLLLHNVVDFTRQYRGRTPRLRKALRLAKALAPEPSADDCAVAIILGLAHEAGGLAAAV